ncbi:uncharacterized protein LOC111676671 [Lucilia cuprina]|uniref:uncharacterized protein LOC111676671 n=1 Tax=Lucilia cuprina TaxID=7375 RepID=UPI001F06C809|nr:uncharacterized protein LOC111676671 [Lucilia cuprina]
MTVSYAGEVPNGSSFGCFWKILWKWRGSVYKLVWRELVAYLCLYYTINFVYRFALTEQQQKIFNKLRSYFGQQGESIPMSFVLGFYVSLVVKRWWEQYRLLPWPDTLALFISAAIPNSNGGVNNETGRLMRRNIMRYMVLAYVITLQRISLRVKRRFPTTQHLVDAGLMHESEMKIFEHLNAKSPMSKYWMPLVWATNIINRARKDGLIMSDHIVQTILMELSDIRRRLGGLIGYDTVCVPLVYTQVVTLVLYTYFIAALLGRQMLPDMPDHNGKNDYDLYFPLFTALQFVFYVGWLKVAEVLINPFGEDDDDIELNWLIDRHIKKFQIFFQTLHFKTSSIFHVIFVFFLLVFFLSFYPTALKFLNVDSRLNGLNVNTSKTRPRIPTPDVTKESLDKDMSNATNANTAVIMAPPLTTQTTMYPYTSTTTNNGQDGQVLGTLLLSPIKEMDSSSSNNTLIPGHPNTAALAQAVLPTNLTNSIPVTTNITTLSFPFTVTTSPTDTSATLNILPISTSQIPTITTSSSNFDANDVITSIPVSLSIQRSPSAVSITDLNFNDKLDNNNTTATALLSVKPLNGGSNISRNNSFNGNLNINISDSYLLERRHSMRSEGRPEDSTDSNLQNNATATITLNTKDNKNPTNTTNTTTATSAPSTLAKRPPEPKTGEVYV